MLDWHLLSCWYTENLHWFETFYTLPLCIMKYITINFTNHSSSLRKSSFDKCIILISNANPSTTASYAFARKTFNCSFHCLLSNRSFIPCSIKQQAICLWFLCCVYLCKKIPPPSIPINWTTIPGKVATSILWEFQGRKKYELLALDIENHSYLISSGCLLVNLIFSNFIRHELWNFYNNNMKK